MNIEWHGPAGADRYTPGRDGNSVVNIVLHTMVGWIASADATFKGGSRLASAHYGVRVDGTIWQWVKEEDTAWQAGWWPMNLRSIGIEHEDGGAYNDPRPDALYSSSAQLVADICRRYNIPCDKDHIFAHREVIQVASKETGKSVADLIASQEAIATGCPDALDTDRIIREAAAILTPPAPVSQDYPVLVAVPDSQNVKYAKAMGIDPTLARLYDDLAPLAGILPEVAFAQACHETGNFTFPGTAKPEWHNPAGLGVTGSAGVGNQFPDWSTGVRAHLGHLLCYFGPHKLGFCDLDQRHWKAGWTLWKDDKKVTLDANGHANLPNDLTQLNGRWAVPGDSYGQSIYQIVDKIRKA